MANYQNPIDIANPFMVMPPVALTVRHVRKIGTEEVREDANNLPRQLKRIDNRRSLPRLIAPHPYQRTVPQNNQRKVPW